MKKLAILLLFPVVLHGQVSKKDLPSLVAVFVGGMADGLNQTLEFHYGDFKRIFPHANDQFWNPVLSWTNKYKYHNPAAGTRFWGSNTVFVATTDGYHLTRFVEHAALVTGLYLRIHIGEHRKWWQYGIEAAEYWMVNRAGMSLVYDGLDKIK